MKFEFGKEKDWKRMALEIFIIETIGDLVIEEFRRVERTNRRFKRILNRRSGI